MPIPTGTAAISFSQLRDEMNAGSGGGYVSFPMQDGNFRGRLTDTAVGATLSLSSLRGNAYQRFTIAANTTNYDIRTALVAAGWNGTAKGSADVVINTNIVVGTPSNTTYAMDTGGPWPAPSTIVVYNSGYIVGQGGDGGNGGGASPSNAGDGRPGAGGGPGLRAQRAMTLVNSGTVGGGGGGGGGGAGRVIAAIPGPIAVPIQTDGGSGGGGARTGNNPSAGGAAGTATGPNSQNGLAGNPGTFAAAGTGGTRNRGGGAGGGWGTAGTGGSGGANPAFPPNPSVGGTGGVAGVAVQGWSLVTAPAPTGTISGPTAG